MGADKAYYGQALREMESGLRRDDFWGKAYARAGGDAQRAKAIYLDLVAQHLEWEATAPERERLRQLTADGLATGLQMTVTGGALLFAFVKRWTIRLAILGVIGVTALLTAVYLYEQHKREEAEKAAMEQKRRLDNNPNSYPALLERYTRGQESWSPSR
ncbi:hypothetical protein [Cupriavidus basilensis]